MKIAMIGHKRIPSREGGIEIVVQEIATRLVAEGHIVHAYNRWGHHVSGKEFDREENLHKKEYCGVRIITIPTLPSWETECFGVFGFGTMRALVEHYDVIHYHAEGPCAMVMAATFFWNSYGSYDSWIGLATGKMGRFCNPLSEIRRKAWLQDTRMS